jgi:hypothetical protein
MLPHTSKSQQAVQGSAGLVSDLIWPLFLAPLAASSNAIERPEEASRDPEPHSML